MIGIDTSFLIAFELSVHPQHLMARSTMARLELERKPVALAPQVISEFVHVATDGKRFAKPLSISAALEVTTAWTLDEQAVVLNTDARAILQFVDWMAKLQLGRKRVLDTLLAATYHTAGITEILTLNVVDFQVFNVFTFVDITVA